MGRLDRRRNMRRLEHRRFVFKRRVAG